MEPTDTAAGPDLPVVVGVDGTSTALRAVAWAAAEARARGVALLIVHAAPYARDEAGRRRAGSVLARARSLARQGDPELDVGTELLDGSAVAALGRAGDSAGLLVLGIVGERLGEITLGSVTLGVVGTTRCPVAVIRGDRRGDPLTRPTVLGVAGPEELDDSSPAAQVAFADARRHAGRLRVVHAGHTHADAARTALLRRALARWSERFPSVPVDLVEAHQRPAEALLHASATARVVVVGSHGRGTVPRILLGSTSRELVRCSHCPVVVVPHAAPSSPVASGVDAVAEPTTA